MTELNVIDAHAMNAGAAQLSDDEVLRRVPLTVELGGKRYEWPVLCRRDARRVRHDLIAIDKQRALYQDALLEQVAQMAQKRHGLDADTLAGLAFMELPDSLRLWEFADAALDFFYKHHAGMAADKSVLDDTEEPDIAEVFEQVRDFIYAPFARTAERVMEKMKAAGPLTNTLNLESTNLSSPNGESVRT